MSSHSIKPQLYILLIGLLLIFMKTLIILLKLCYEVTYLAFSLLLSLLGILIQRTILQHPITVIILIIVGYWMYKNELKKLKMQEQLQHNEDSHIRKTSVVNCIHKINTFLYNLLIRIFSSQQTCCICLAEHEQVDYILPECGHYYHQRCIISWLNNQRMEKNCPLCRKEIKVDQLGDYQNNRTRRRRLGLEMGKRLWEKNNRKMCVLVGVVWLFM